MVEPAESKLEKNSKNTRKEYLDHLLMLTSDQSIINESVDISPLIIDYHQKHSHSDALMVNIFIF